MRATSQLMPDRPRAEVRRLGFAGDDAALALALRRGDPGAPAALYDRYAAYLRRVLARVLGVDDELPEVLHETFAQALASIDKLEDPDRLKGWLVRIAIFTARGTIRRRQRRRWLRFGPPNQIPELQTAPASTESKITLDRVFAILDKMPTKERVPFTLRFLEGMQLTDIADACDISLSSVKRYLKRAEKRFVHLAERDPLLRDRIAQSRWSKDGA
ncbi:MAG: sigma-70 family RNA polymerase sigma factor [Myxococcota bacterium]